MADPTDIPAPLSDRTHAHGRNVMAVAGVIVVLAWVPYIEITSFEPLGFDINEGGELSVWGILAVVLFYYAIRFGVECRVDYTGWIDTYRKSLAGGGSTTREFANNRHVRRLKRKFLWLDVAPPAAMFLAALIARFNRLPL